MPWSASASKPSSGSKRETFSEKLPFGAVARLGSLRFLPRSEAWLIAFSPDGAEIAFVAVTDAMEAVSTNGDVFTVKADGSAAPARLTTNPAFDGAPAYSPDGKWLAYRAQSRPGNEADLWRLMKYDRQGRTHAEVASGFDRSVSQLAWTSDNQTI